LFRSIAGSWQVAPGSGSFSYSYPIDVPKPGMGSAPSVAIGYSSAAVDGLTLAGNTQASPVGLGWSDFANAYIERRYEQCYKVHLSDLCWQGDNAVISLGGMFGPLVAVNAERTQWKLLSDPGWLIERGDFAKYTNIYGNQAWKVTGPDGTVYIFGGGHMPGRQTGSVLGVPVLADDDGEPCRPAPGKLGGCEQGWRWYLDRIIDPDGNETAFLYERETNIYSAVLGIGDNVRYDRGAVLKEIIYGGRNWDPATYSARVLFDTYHRCYYLTTNCPPATKDHGGFPDAPTDLICESLTKGTCSVHSPAFFTTRFYKFARTEVKVGGVWKPAAKYEFSHAWGDSSQGVSDKMRITAIQRIGVAFGKQTRFPATQFGYKILDNRSDHDSNIPKAMRHMRINSVTNPYGGVTSVTYFQNRGCAPSYKPPTDPDISVVRWDQNVRDCFPQEVKDNDFTGTGIYNKWLVKEVSESDAVTAQAIKTTYAYLDDPAWAYDFSAIQRDQAAIGWSSWRGYGRVEVRTGTSATRMTIFRGWDRDHFIEKTGGTGWTLGDRHWSVTADDGTSFVDDPALAGLTLEEIQLGTLDGAGGTKLLRRTHRYETRVINPLPGYRFPVQWVGLASTTESVATAPGVWRHRRSQTTYNTHFQPTTTLEEGWLDVSGDERCSITTYADDEARNMFVYPAVNKKVAGSCASTNVLTESQTSYDTRGKPTVQRTRIDDSTWAQTTTEFDVGGRPVKVTGPLGETVTTVYTVATGGASSEIPVRTVTTNALGHQQITTYQPEFRTPTRQEDANGNIVAYEYDEFGRTKSVWLPTEAPGSANPSWRFSYDLPNKATRTQRLTACCSPVVYEDTWVINDGLGRERQVQGRSTDATKVLMYETTYDDRGMMRDQTVEQAFTGTPGKYIAGGSSWLNRTRHSYDELGREIVNEWFRGAAPARSTSTVYGSDTVTVTGPDGRRVRERVDGLGRTVAVEEADGAAWVTSSYSYDLADRLIGATDPAGNKISYSYNMAGWRIGQTDPNRGNALFGYDLAGQQTAMWTESGLIYTSFDVLGRPLQRRADNATTGPLLASWQYDTA
ncbi:MAG TPA: hypothetical protein DGG94_07400, partial [Micromonosporaceae bacterium]|nr:hypothetical protein [Micromonosporaceae bacterium]